MAIPTTRTLFAQNCLRRLGAGAKEINVTDEQIDDRIDEALAYYGDYHFDASEKTYYKHQVTDTDKTNRYITLPENIMGAVKIFPIGTGTNTNNLFNIRYQIALNDLYTLTSVSMVPYYMAMQHIRVLEELLVGQQPIRYSRHRNILYVDMDWDKVDTGQFLIVEAYDVIDPTVYADVWKDRWLLQYCTALIKRQWGANLKFYDGMTLPNGITFNGQRTYDEAIEEIRMLEEEMISTYSLPASDFIA